MSRMRRDPGQRETLGKPAQRESTTVSSTTAQAGSLNQRRRIDLVMPASLTATARARKPLGPLALAAFTDSQ
jgi:hypothetical protein